jgi:hypothetical protein
LTIAVFGPTGPETGRSRTLAQAVGDPSRPGAEVVQLDPGRSLPPMVAVLVSELEARGGALETLGSERDALRERVEQLRAEIARLAAERAEAEWRHDAAVRRSEELAPAMAEPRDERGRNRPKCGLTASASRVPAVEITMAKAPTEEGWAEHQATERFPAAVRFSADGEPADWSERLPKLGPHTSAPISGPGDEPETPQRTFPGEADLALVGAQLDILDQLLRNGPSTEHLLIDQQRLTEFVLKIREASRLARRLASVLEQSRRRDEMEYHLYLFRRAGEIDKTV